MTTLEIKYHNYLTFKDIHDMIMDTNPDIIEFIEDEVNEFDEDPNVAFRLAHYVRNFYPVIINYITYKTDFPMNLLEPELVFRGIPFNEISLNDKIYKFDE